MKKLALVSVFCVAAFVMSAQNNLTVNKTSQVLLLTGPSLDSTNSTAFRANAMAGLFGDTVPTDRTNPAAYCVIGNGNNTSSGAGLLWSDLVVTGTGGRRILAPVYGYGSPNEFEFEYRTSITNFPGKFRFGIATNSSGAELTFSLTYVGFDFGQNGVIETRRENGQWVVGGDDRIITSGPPSAAGHLDGFARLGATLYFVANNASEVKSVTDQFQSSVQYITGILYKNGVPVASNMVSTAGLVLVLTPIAGTNTYMLTTKGGQPNLPYIVERSSSIDQQSQWLPVGPGKVYAGYPDSLVVTNVTGPNATLGFFRSYLVRP